MKICSFQITTRILSNPLVMMEAELLLTMTRYFSALQPKFNKETHPPSPLRHILIIWGRGTRGLQLRKRWENNVIATSCVAVIASVATQRVAIYYFCNCERICQNPRSNLFCLYDRIDYHTYQILTETNILLITKSTTTNNKI